MLVSLDDTVVVDFETVPIGKGRPDYPPEPVGVAVLAGRSEPRYLAWGHPTGNNCTRDDARQVLMAVVESGSHVLMHNAPFDLSVMYERMGVPIPDWRRVHDTMILLFLNDPHNRSLALKPAATKLLGMAPDEQDEVAEWVWEHREKIRQNFPDWSLANRKQAAALVAAAPGDLAGRYACGDVVRTQRLYKALAPRVSSRGMADAYAREIRVMLHLLENERGGIRVDLKRLQHDAETLPAALKASDDWLSKHLNSPGTNWDASQEVAEAFTREGVVPEDAWVLTESGEKSTSKDNMPASIMTDPQVAQVWTYRQRLKTVLGTFTLPWYEQAQQTGGRIHTQWNTTLGEGGGTRTGRPSTRRPNVLNIPKALDDKAPAPDFLDVGQVPRVRAYVLPEEGHVLLGRDFSGQELRVFAHFEKGDLYRAYHRDPATDPHAFVQGLIRSNVGMDVDRGPVKAINFLSIYGGGAPALSKRLGISIDQARSLLAAHDAALPGRRQLSNLLTSMVKSGVPIRTVGGRLYTAEEPRDGREFHYKLINHLVQGSAADLTKESITEWCCGQSGTARFLLSIYDENVISAPEDEAHEHMAFLKEVMERDRIDVPMLTDGEIGYNWAEMSPCE